MYWEIIVMPWTASIHRVQFYGFWQLYSPLKPPPRSRCRAFLPPPRRFLLYSTSYPSCLSYHWSPFCRYKLGCMLYKWMHPKETPLFLASFIQHNDSETCPCCCVYHEFILIYRGVDFHYTGRPWFVSPSSTDGRWDCFQSLAIANQTAVNIQVQVFMWKHVFISFW